MQQGNRGRAPRAAGVHIALPMRIADDPALPERQAALEQCVGAIRIDLGQDQGPGPARRRMARRTGLHRSAPSASSDTGAAFAPR
ncbi:hypothetical protein G6F24_016848 [Rhizopus arrhizus]|nr:hypothetical protein G6F24_016848 [Rhizopus arrhizus]